MVLFIYSLAVLYLLFHFLSLTNLAYFSKFFVLNCHVAPPLAIVVAVSLPIIVNVVLFSSIVIQSL